MGSYSPASLAVIIKQSGKNKLSIIKYSEESVSSTRIVTLPSVDAGTDLFVGCYPEKPPCNFFPLGLLCCPSLQELSALSSCGRLQLRRADRTAPSTRSAALLAGSQQACEWTDVARLCTAEILVIVMAIRPDAASALERHCRLVGPRTVVRPDGAH